MSESYLAIESNMPRYTRQKFKHVGPDGLPAKLPPSIDVHAHAIAPSYRDHLIKQGYTHPDGFPGIPVSANPLPFLHSYSCLPGMDTRSSYLFHGTHQHHPLHPLHLITRHEPANHQRTSPWWSAHPDSDFQHGTLGHLQKTSRKVCLLCESSTSQHR